MKDYRSEIIKSIEAELVHYVPPDWMASISDAMIRILSDYEITERCTDVAVLDDTNTKLLKRYCACLMVDGKSKRTIEQYQRAVQRLSDVIGKSYTEMTAYDIRYHLACEKQRGIANSTLENIRSNLSAFFSWMVNDEIIEKNPMSTVGVIKIPDEIRKAFSDIEIDAMRSACRNTKERALVEFLLSTGIRVDELSQMDISDVNFTDLSVHIRHGKGNKERITYMSNVCAKRLSEYLRDRKDYEVCLFRNKNYDRIGTDGIRYILKGIEKRSGVDDVHPHRFRRTFATRLASRGMPIQEIQVLMGHSKIDTTLRYVCVDDTSIQSSYKKYIA